MNQKERDKYSQEFIRINRQYEKKYFPKIRKAIKAKVSSLTSDIKNKGIEAAQASLSTDIVNVELSNVVKKLYLEVGLRHSRKTYRYIKAEALTMKNRSVPLETKGFGFNEQWIAFILNYLQEFLLQKITYTVNETTRRVLTETLQQGIADGIGIDEMVARLEALPLTNTQAARITRTEINRAANVGTMAAVDTSEWEMQKEWISATDYRVRGRNPKDHADHWQLNGQVVDFEEKFRDRKSGDLLMFPGDPKASAATTVNCRCSAAPIAKRDANGNLVPKAQAYAPVLGMLRPPIAASPAFTFQVGKA
jgi:hypothetical protein